MSKPVKPKRVANAPVKDVILTGKKVDLYKLPVPVFSVMDGGPMITGGVIIAEDPDHGMNAGMYRLMLKEKNVTGIDIVTPNNLRRFTERALAKKRPLPVSISIGTHPYECVASTFKANLGVNELTFAKNRSGWRKERPCRFRASPMLRSCWREKFLPKVGFIPRGRSASSTV
jgi:2,5-furandicarboxylate decarboxylase 1